MKTPPLFALFMSTLCAVAGCAPAHASDTTMAEKSHPELGAVSWGRSFERAQAQSKNSGKPMFVLFDEVPGCSTVKAFADEVLTHPALVDAIEGEFVPVAIMNNHAGPDRVVLDHFGEPAWNNPVVRLMDHQETMLTKRSTALDAPTVALRMVEALQKARRTVPLYLALVAEDAPERRRKHKEAVFGMYCFWSGEVAFGALDGVVSTKPGHHQGEVVVVTYDPTKLSLRALLSYAKKSGAADRVWLRDEAEVTVAREVFGNAGPLSGRISPASGDDKKQMTAAGVSLAGLSVAQQAKVNAALGQRNSVAPYLSPRQRARIVR